MFKRKTVFILGAGASWHYGYPTGEKLVHLVIEQSRELADFCAESTKTLNPFLPKPIKIDGAATGQQIQAQWQSLMSAAIALSKRLEQVNPTLIDYFLAQNRDLQAIGKLVIAMVILKREHNFNIKNKNSNRIIQGVVSAHDDSIIVSGDDWLRFVLYKMTAGCSASKDILENQLSFVTFNYDTSLERRLLRGLESISHFDKGDIERFFVSPRISHVYGQICEPATGPLQVRFPLPSVLSRNGNADDRESAQTTINNCFAASKGIFTIDGEEKEQGVEVLEQARKVIAEAETIYILGYGFDEANNRRLLLRQTFESFAKPRDTMFTNFGGLARVSKAASRIMFGMPANFIDKKVHQKSPLINGVPTHHNWEMSTKNCYDALAEDFESLEE